MNDAKLFLNELIETIDLHDKLHSKKINANVTYLTSHYPVQFEELLGLVSNYFSGLKMTPAAIATDYLKMIADMRKEGLYFYKHGKYRCTSQTIAYENVYSKKEIMSYYMNALLVSQILWKHHFNIFMYFQKQLKTLFAGKKELSILDVGPGHGFFSFLVKKEFPDYKKIDIVDISETSLLMTERIIGHDGNKISYYKKDIFDYDDTVKYDFIVLGEVIEHLDDPKGILIKLSKLLNEGGLLWVTTPTNSPALDHVYLFHTKADVIRLLEDSGLKIADVYHCFAEDMDEETALKNKVTDLV
ncbi:MAG: class I SAM-dependent methyltransferase, partial [Ferruginibacter sp.]